MHKKRRKKTMFAIRVKRKLGKYKRRREREGTRETARKERKKSFARLVKETVRNIKRWKKRE